MKVQLPIDVLLLIAIFSACVGYLVALFSLIVIFPGGDLCNI